MPSAAGTTLRLNASLTALALLVVRAGAAQQPAPIDTTNFPPAGFGTLHQEDVAIRLAAANVQLRFLPLDERVIRLLAPDSYASLRRLTTTRAADIERALQQHGLRRAQLFLVTFFGTEPRAQFVPEDVTVNSQNQLFRPVAIVPLSPLWSELRLNQRETASAIYLYEDAIALSEPLTVSYDGVSSSSWEQTLRDLDRERARVFSRAAAAPRRP